MSDTFHTLDAPSEGIYKEKMSKFLAFAIPVVSAKEAKEHIGAYQKKYFDARHVCWAYMIGAARTEFQSNDNGEPSGTAGKPILGQINSFGLTNLLIVVVRYFGGIKLGTPGLIAAYREAARLAIEDSGRKEVVEEAQIALTCRYESVNGVMKIVKELNLTIVSQEMGMECSYVLSMPRSFLDGVSGRLDKLNGVRME